MRNNNKNAQHKTTKTKRETNREYKPALAPAPNTQTKQKRIKQRIGNDHSN